MMLFVTTAFSQQIYNVRVSLMADGKFEQQYGTIKVGGDVLNGMKDDNWIENHPNSDIPHFIIQYKEDKKNGLYLEFDKQANLIKMIDYEDDRGSHRTEFHIAEPDFYFEGDISTFEVDVDY